MTGCKNLVLFASGSGTNVENIFRYFEGNTEIRVSAVFCNQPQAGVWDRARRLKLPCELIDRLLLGDKKAFLAKLEKYKPDLLVLAGFLWLIPGYLVKAYPRQIINIHPALLPDFGGKGMYGLKVHEAVLAAGRSLTGITIHYVDEGYDSGHIIFQAAVKIEECTEAQDIADKIHPLEYEWYPVVIEGLVQNNYKRRKKTEYGQI